MGNLISTLTSAKTGTVVKKMLNDYGELRKTIKYGEKTPLRKIGIDTVHITSNKNGHKCCEYYSQNGNKHLFSCDKGEDGYVAYASCPRAAKSLIDFSSFQKTVKNFIDALRASKAMMG